MKTIEFTIGANMVYSVGERYTFDDAVADAYVASGRAKYVKAPKSMEAARRDKVMRRERVATKG